MSLLTHSVDYFCQPEQAWTLVRTAAHHGDAPCEEFGNPLTRWIGDNPLSLKNGRELLLLESAFLRDHYTNVDGLPQWSWDPDSPDYIENLDAEKIDVIAAFIVREFLRTELEWFDEVYHESPSMNPGYQALDHILTHVKEVVCDYASEKGIHSTNEQHLVKR